MGKKQADPEITDGLEFVEEQIELVQAYGGDDDSSGDLRSYRRLEVLLRRLAREAGYELPVT